MIGIIGTGGHAEVVVDIINRTTVNPIFTFFSKSKATLFEEYGEVLLESEETIAKFISKISKWHVAIGDQFIRKEKMKYLLKHDQHFFLAIHDKSVVSTSCKIDLGTSVMAGAVINPYVYIGAGCIINTTASIDHDCVIGDYVNIGPGCKLAGGVKVGDMCDLGTGVVVIPGISIGSNSVIGAGAVVVEDIPDNSVAVGVPAKVIKSRYV